MKGFFQSKTIIGAIIAIVGTIASQKGWASESEIAQWFELGAQVVGVVMVIIGRITAKGPISGVFKTSKSGLPIDG